jgi:hypothetical protein
MNSTMILKLLFISFLLIIGDVLIAQPGISIYTDMGSNNVSNGIFIKSAALGFYKYGKNNFETGIETNLKNNNKNGFSGYTISASRNMAIKDISFRLKGFCTLTLPSEILSETNWGALMEMRHKRFEMSIGTNFRTYNLRKKAFIGYEIDKNSTQIHEIYNLMYSFCYFLKPTDENWNMGLSVTNIDYFNINQETNPVLNLKGMYKISSPVALYVQASYKSAGVTNLELNYFGFFFRTGLIWNIN